MAGGGGVGGGVGVVCLVGAPLRLSALELTAGQRESVLSSARNSLAKLCTCLLCVLYARKWPRIPGAIHSACENHQGSSGICSSRSAKLGSAQLALPLRYSRKCAVTCGRLHNPMSSCVQSHPHVANGIAIIVHARPTAEPGGIAEPRGSTCHASRLSQGLSLCSSEILALFALT